MLINKLCGVNISVVYNKFNKEINILIRHGILKEEIESDIYTTILNCSKHFDEAKKSSFFKYLYTSISKNLNGQIKKISAKNQTEEQLKDDFFYIPKEKNDTISDIVSKLNSKDLDNFGDYCSGKISENEFIDFYGEEKLILYNVIERVHQFLDEED